MAVRMVHVHQQIVQKHKPVHRHLLIIIWTAGLQKRVQRHIRIRMVEILTVHIVTKMRQKPVHR